MICVSDINSVPQPDGPPCSYSIAPCYAAHQLVGEAIFLAGGKTGKNFGKQEIAYLEGFT